MLLAKISALIIALMHVYFMILEMFLWTKPLGLKIFRHDQHHAKVTKKLAMNQGLYNGFLAAGLFYGVLTSSMEFNVFFLSCVVLAGLFGGFSLNKSIFIVQGMPALVALFFNLLVTLS
jgi:putative membrane protein